MVYVDGFVVPVPKRASTPYDLLAPCLMHPYSLPQPKRRVPAGHAWFTTCATAGPSAATSSIWARIVTRAEN
jgi:hypothetical protein